MAWPLVWRAEEELSVGEALSMAAIEGGAVANGDEHILKAVALLTVIVDVAGSNCVGRAGIGRETRERRDTAGITEDEIVL